MSAWLTNKSLLQCFYMEIALGFCLGLSCFCWISWMFFGKIVWVSLGIVKYSSIFLRYSGGSQCFSWRFFDVFWKSFQLLWDAVGFLSYSWGFYLCFVYFVYSRSFLFLHIEDFVMFWAIVSRGNVLYRILAKYCFECFNQHYENIGQYLCCLCSLYYLYSFPLPAANINASFKRLMHKVAWSVMCGWNNEQSG